MTPKMNRSPTSERHLPGWSARKIVHGPAKPCSELGSLELRHQLRPMASTQVKLWHAVAMRSTSAASSRTSWSDEPRLGVFHIGKRVNEWYIMYKCVLSLGFQWFWLELYTIEKIRNPHSFWGFDPARSETSATRGRMVPEAKRGAISSGAGLGS